MRGVNAKSSGENPASKHRAYVRKRTTWLFVVYAALFAALAVRLFYVQVLGNSFYKAKADGFRFRKFDIPASRGIIHDRNGRVLAVNIKTVSVSVDTREVVDMPATVKKLAHMLCKDPKAVEEKLAGKPRVVQLARQVDAGIGVAINQRKRELPGVSYTVDTKRIYPAGQLAAQIIGFTNIDNKGAEGIERVYDGELTGAPGLYTAELDSERRVIPITRRAIKDAANGKDVYLTIDLTIQQIAEQALATMAQTYTPDSACAIVMDPKTGEILALANYPSYDTNIARQVKPELWRNRAVTDLYEPGSTLKAVTIAGGLNEGFPPNVPYAYCKGRERLKGGVIPCVLHHPYEKGHGAVDMFKIIKYSCNIGAAHVGLKLGSERLRKYEKAFGLTQKLDAGFGCEAGVLPIPQREWARQIRIANVGFGQGIAVTPMQMAAAYATIANRGRRMQPGIISRIENADGSVSGSFQARPVTRAVCETAADELTKMLRGCVEEGTGKPARIEGRTVAGKTGSAQIPRADGRGYEKGAYIASFMGFAPVTNPRISITVVVIRPKNSHWGATVAAPVFKEIGEKTLWYLKVPADAPVKIDDKHKPNAGKKNVA